MCVTFCHRRQVLFWNHQDCEALASNGNDASAPDLGQSPLGVWLESLSSNGNDDPSACDFAAGPHSRCEDCRHRRDEEEEHHCSLTNAPLPECGGCCHHNVELVEGPQVVTRDMLAPLGLTWEVTEEFILLDLDVPYGRDWRKQITVNPDDLGLPFTYGLSTEHMPEEEFDWTEWQQQWCSEEAY